MEIDFNRGRWAPNTRRVYESCWRDWAAWCAANDRVALPSKPEDIAEFLTERAKTLSTQSISSRNGAILAINALYGNIIVVKATCLRDALSEIRRTKGTAHVPKTALPAEAILDIVAHMPDELIQERALLLVGFSAALRRSELVALDREDIDITPGGATLTIRHSKTDKTGKGEHVGIPRSGGSLCAVAALERWLDAASISAGPVFLGAYGARMAPRRVATLCKRWAGKSGFSEREIGAHSLRRGCITTMHGAGIDLRSGMSHSRHKTTQIYLGYVQEKAALENPAVKALRFS
jgi:site-specific recombinase XerC